MTQEYSNPERASDTYSLPDVEIFELSQSEAADMTGDAEAEGGWFWWTCLPGCLPDSEASGPFKTYYEALNDARDTE